MLSPIGNFDQPPQTRLSEAGHFGSALEKAMQEAAESLNAPAIPRPGVEHSPAPAEPEKPAEFVNPFNEVSNGLLKRIMNAENTDQLPEVAGAAGIPVEERGTWFLGLQAGARAEIERRKAANQQGKTFKTLDELNANKPKVAEAKTPDSDETVTAPELSLDTDKFPAQTEVKPRAEALPQTDAEKYDAKYAAMGEDKIMDLGYRISELGDDTVTKDMSVEEQKALARAYNRIMSTAHAEYDQVGPSWILHWKQNEGVKPLPRGYQAILDARAKQAQIELTEQYRQMSSMDLIKMADDGAEIRSKAELEIYGAQLERAQKEIAEVLAGLGPQEIIKEYEARRANPEDNKGMYMDLLAKKYEAAQKKLENWRAKYHHMSDDAIIGLSEERIKAMSEAEFDIYAEEYQKAVKHRKELLADKNHGKVPRESVGASPASQSLDLNAIHAKYNSMDTAGILHAADEAFAGKMSDTEFDVFIHKYNAALNNMHVQLNKMPRQQIISIYEQFKGDETDAPRHEGLLKVMEPFYARAKSAQESYDIFNKALKHGEDDFMKGIDYLSTEELETLYDYATSPQEAGRLQRKFNRAAKRRNKLTAKVVRGRATALEDGVARAAAHLADSYRRQREALPNVADTQLLTKRHLREVERELTNRDVADEYIQKQFDAMKSIAEKQGGIFEVPEQFIDLDKAPPVIKQAIEKGDAGIGNQFIREAYDRRVLRMMQKSPYLADSILLWRDKHAKLHNQLATRAAQEQLHDLYLQRMSALDERMRGNDSRGEAA